MENRGRSTPEMPPPDYENPDGNAKHYSRPQQKKRLKQRQVLKGMFFAALAMAASLFICAVACTDSLRPANKEEGCGSEYVTKEISATINGKKTKIAKVMISKCAIRISRPKTPALDLRFLFEGEIADNVLKSEESEPITHSMHILYFSLENSNVSLDNPFVSGSCRMFLANYEQGHERGWGESFIFNPK